MKKIQYSILLLLLLSFSISLLGQGQRANWLMGYREPPYDNERQPVQMHWEAGKYAFSPVPEDVNFESTFASISDSAGQLLLYTNGCAIYDATHQIISGGDHLNPGKVRDLACPKYGYMLPEAALFLPAPGHKDKFYLLHIKARLHRIYRIQPDRIFYTTISTKDNGDAEVIEHQKMLTSVPVEGFAVTKHANGRDWWIVVSEQQKNAFDIYLLDPEGMHFVATQTLGPALSDPVCQYPGSMRFSPDGTKLARATLRCGLTLLDFDRCAGTLSNPVYVPEVYTDFGHLHIAFSPDSRSLFMVHEGLEYWHRYFQRKIRRLDFDKLGVVLHPIYEQPLPKGIAPENIILWDNETMILSNIHSTGVMHVIHDANSKEDTILLEPNAIKIPSLNMRTLPYFPNYDLGPLKGSVCDTVNTTKRVAPVHVAIELSPNPVIDRLSIRFSPHRDYDLKIYNTAGKTVYSTKIDASITDFDLDLTEFSSGSYMIHFRGENFSYMEKFIKL